MSYAAQARREIAAAYRPANRQLSRQEKRVKSMDRKQARDENAFQNWLRDTNASLNAESRARDTQLQGVESQYNQQIQAAMGDAFGGAAQRAAAVGRGPVGTAQGAPQDPVAGDSLTRAGAAYGLAQSAAFGGRLAVSQGLGHELSISTEKNSYATVAQIRAQRRAATYDALSKIADQRGDLKMKQAADSAKRAADLEAAAAKEAQQRLTNELAMERIAQGDERIAQGNRRLSLDEQATNERLRQGRIRNQLARGRFKETKRQNRLQAKGGGLSPSERRQRATIGAENSSKIQAAINFANRTHTDKAGVPKGPKKPTHGPGYATRLANWLMSATDIGNQTLANVAAYKATNPGKPLPSWLARDLKRLNGQV